MLGSINPLRQNMIGIQFYMYDRDFFMPQPFVPPVKPSPRHFHASVPPYVCTYYI